MSYRKSYPNLSFESRVMMMEGDEFDAEADYLNNQYRNQKNYGGTVTPAKISAQGPNGAAGSANPMARVRLDFPVYPDEVELKQGDSQYIRHDLDPFLNPSGDTGDQDPIQTGARVNLKSFGNDPAYNGKTNNLRMQFGSVGNSAGLQSLAGASVGIANLNFGGANPNPSRPKGGKGYPSQSELTKDTQIPGAFIPATTRITSPYSLSRTITLTRNDGTKYTKTSPHRGVDFGGGKRSQAGWNGMHSKTVATRPEDQEPCFAVFDGKVTRLTMQLGKDSGYGCVMYIEHNVKDKGGNDRKIQTRYGHIEYTNLKKGDEVKKGDPIAHIGSQGGSTGPHLHFEVRNHPYKNADALDPVDVFGWSLGPPPPPHDNGHVENDFPEEENLDEAEDA